MTEQIIIDGVDVSGCHHYKNETCIADYLTSDKDFSKAECKANSNCYYKQLARKTAECEELKQKLLQLNNESVDVCLMIKATDELQNKLQIVTEALKESLEVFDEYDMMGSYENARQALERIKE